MASIGPIAWALARVPPGRAAAWQALTGWEMERRAVGAELAALLGAPDAATLPLAVLRPEDGTGGVLLVEAEGAVAPLRTLGWAAAELTCAGLAGVWERACAHGFRPLGAPAPLGSGASVSACQVADPGGAVLYFADVRGYSGRATLHRATRDVDRLFIAVLASPDFDASRRWYGERFATAPVTDHAVRIPVLEAAWSRGPEARWRIGSQQLDGGCLIEIDQYPDGAPARARDRWGLVGGVNAVAVVAPQPGAPVAAIGPAGERLIVTPDGAVP